MDSDFSCTRYEFPLRNQISTLVTGVLAQASLANYSARMSRVNGWVLALALVLSLRAEAGAVSKIHVISFGKWISVQWFANEDERSSLILKIRALIVDGRVKENVVGLPHDITDRLFVVRRAFRMNESLADETGASRWRWQRGGWLLVDRVTGRVSALNLPEFDPFYSAGAWYRDYIAYCTVGEDGKKIYAVVAQVARRKPVLKKLLSNDGARGDATPDSACAMPVWQRDPTRVTFELPGGAGETYSIRGRVVDLVNDMEDDEEGSK